MLLTYLVRCPATRAPVTSSRR